MSTVEDAIKQTKPLNVHQKGLLNILLTHNFVSTKLQSFLDGFEITIPQYNVLRILRGQFPKNCSNSLIKERMLYKNTDVTRLMDRLVSKGLVNRIHSTKDRRCVELIISEQGQKILSKIDTKFDNVINILEALSETEVTTLNTLLDKIRQTN